MKRLIITALALGLTSGGCAVAWDVPNDVVWVDNPPPAYVVEETPVQPGPTYVWVTGYWYWTGARYLWIKGRWRRPPAPGHLWVGGGWVHHNGRYRYVPGRWSSPKRVPVYRYSPARPHPHIRRPSPHKAPPGGPPHGR